MLHFEVVEVKAAVVVVEGVEEIVGHEAAVEEVATMPTPPVAVPEMEAVPVTREPGPLTFPQVNGGGVECTSGGGNPLSFVLSPPPVHGRTSSSRSLQRIENPASSKVIKK